jgi:hypothetical protein
MAAPRMALRKLSQEPATDSVPHAAEREPQTEHMIDSSDILIWIHTCPQRAGVLGKLEASLRASDVGARYEVHVCEEKGVENVERWNRDKLLELTQRSRWVVRLEDDVVVSPNFLHNLQTWSALCNPVDFGIGALYLHRLYTDDALAQKSFRRDLRNGSMFFDVQDACGAQAMVFCADTYRQLYDQPVVVGADMDVGLTRACNRTGLRLYVYPISQAQCSSVASQSALGNQNGWQYTSGTFDPSFRYEGRELYQDVTAPWCQGDVFAAYYDVGSDVLRLDLAGWYPRDISFMTAHNGSPIIVSGPRVYPSRSEAKASRWRE